MLLKKQKTYINGEEQAEPYVSEKALGECDLDFPYQVPESRYFLLGDHRKTSVDSRSSAVGCVAEEQIVGKIVFRVWPLADLGILSADFCGKTWHILTAHTVCILKADGLKTTTGRA